MLILCAPCTTYSKPGEELVFGLSEVALFFSALAGFGTLADNNGKNCGGYFCPDAVGSALIIGIGTAPVWIPGSISLIRFNQRKEIAVTEEYENTGKLPLYVQRKLAQRFYDTNYRF